MHAFVVHLNIWSLIDKSSVDPDQTAPVILSGSTMFASMLMLNGLFSDAVILLAF